MYTRNPVPPKRVLVRYQCSASICILSPAFCFSDPCACVRCPPKTVCNFDGKYLAYCARQCSAPKDCPQGYFCKTNKLVYPPASCIEGGTCGYFAHGYCLKVGAKILSVIFICININHTPSHMCTSIHALGIIHV